MPTQRTLHEIETLAPLSMTVLILGETGVGKDLVARELHARSRRAHAPLVVVNCAALPLHLVESDLFGHVRGAFTGATAARAGKFEAAHGGTLFLDEVGELPPAVQPALLRVLQDGEIQRVGADQSHQVDVRVVAATNRDLQAEVAAGRFRADLYHRLAVFTLRVPPLRERKDELPRLADEFARAFAGQLGVDGVEFSPSALSALLGHGWPGNVRELKHAVERAMVRALARRRERVSLVLHAADFDLDEGPLLLRGAAGEDGPIEPLAHTLERARRYAFLRALTHARGNVTQAARLLRVGRSSAYREVLRLGLWPVAVKLEQERGAGQPGLEDARAPG